MAALGPDEDDAPLPRFSEPFEVPSDFRGDLGGKRDGALARLRLRRVGLQAALVELREGFLDADLARLEVKSSAAARHRDAPDTS